MQSACTPPFHRTWLWCANASAVCVCVRIGVRVRMCERAHACAVWMLTCWRVHFVMLRAPRFRFRTRVADLGSYQEG